MCTVLMETIVRTMKPAARRAMMSTAVAPTNTQPAAVMKNTAAKRATIALPLAASCLKGRNKSPGLCVTKILRTSSVLMDRAGVQMVKRAAH